MKNSRAGKAIFGSDWSRRTIRSHLPEIRRRSFSSRAKNCRTVIRALLRERIMRPIGVADREWSVGYGKTYMVDELPLVPSWGGGAFTARATARVGRLILRGGDWQGKPILSAQAVRAITEDAGTPGNGALGWWTNSEGEPKAVAR